MQYMNYLLALLEITFLLKIGWLGGRGNINDFVIFTLELREKGVGTATVSLTIRLLGRPGGCGCESPLTPQIEMPLHITFAHYCLRWVHKSHVNLCYLTDQDKVVPSTL